MLVDVLCELYCSALGCDAHGLKDPQKLVMVDVKLSGPAECSTSTIPGFLRSLSPQALGADDMSFL